MTQIEGDVRSRLITRAGCRLQAAQDDFLQPWRHIRIDGTRRRRRTPQAVAHSGVRLGITERLLACGELVEQHAEGEEIAARIAAIALQLFR